MKKKITAATPIICLIAYLLMGFLANLWHPGWVVFLLVPLVSSILNGSVKIVSVYTILVVIVYLILGFTIDGWHPWWILFLTIPVVSIFAKPTDEKEKKKEKETVIDAND